MIKSIGLLAVSFLYLSIVTSLEAQILQDHLNCDSHYDCAPEYASPFALGKEYFYVYNVSSTLKLGESVSALFSNRPHNTTTKSVASSDGLLVLKPITICEIIVLLKAHEHVEQSPSLKVAFWNGNIKRVCYSQSDQNDFQINILKSLFPLLLLEDQSKSSSDDVVVEHTSKGKCLTKYEHCEGSSDTMVRYESANSCNSEDSILKNIQTKTEDFRHVIAEFSKASNAVCKITFSQHEQLNVPEGLTVCVLKKTNGLVTSAKCEETLDVGKIPLPVIQEKFYNSVFLNLEKVKVKATDGVDESMAFTKTSIHQIVPLKRKSRMVLSLKDFQSVLKGIENTTGFSFDAFDYTTQQQVDLLRKRLQTSTENDDLSQFVLDLQNTSQSGIKVILKILGHEANNENVCEIIETVLVNNSLLSQLSEDDAEDILRVILETLSSAEPTEKLLQFSELMINYTFTNSQHDFSEKTKLASLVAYSNLLKNFCARLVAEEQKYLMNLLMNSRILKLAQEASSMSEKIMFLEAIPSLVYSRNGDSDGSTRTIYGDTNKVLRLISIRTCHKDHPCSNEAKRDMRAVLQNNEATANERILAFLSLERCFMKSDAEAVRSLIPNPTNNTKDLLSFIRRYASNKEVNGLPPRHPLLQIFPEHIDTVGIHDDMNVTKPGKASNTILAVQIPHLPIQLQMETNILYFDTPSNLPEVITVSISSVSRNKIVPILEVEAYIDHITDSSSAQDFVATIIVRKLGVTVFIKELSISQEMLLDTLQKIRNMFTTRESAHFAKSFLQQFILNALDIDIFMIEPVLRGNLFLPTVSGIPFDLSWSIDSFTRFQIGKSDCMSLFASDISSGCHLAIKPELNLVGELSLSFSPLHVYKKGYTLKGNLSVMLPIQIDLTRSKEALEESIKLTLPSLSASLAKMHADFSELGENKSVSSFYRFFGVGMMGILQEMGLYEDAMKQTSVIVTRNRASKVFQIQVTDAKFEADMEKVLVDDRHYKIRGNLYYHKNSPAAKRLSFQVGYQNVEGSKKLQAHLLNGANEYSVEAYFVRIVKNQNVNPMCGLFLCGGYCLGTGILCMWPYCEFCGTEYFIGANFNTPETNNVKLFEAAVTQIFPSEKIDVVVTSENVPILGKVEFRGSLTQGNDTQQISNLSLKNVVNEKLRKLFTPSNQGDALPESLSAEETHLSRLYFLDVKFIADFIGRSGISIAYISLKENPWYTTDSRIVAGELLYQTKRMQQEESLSSLSSFIYPHKLDGFISKSTFRSTQFPIVSFDWNCKYQTLPSLEKKVTIVIRPFNAIRGEIQLEILDHQPTTSANVDNFHEKTASWNDYQFNQTYKVQLPDPFTIHILKWHVFLKRMAGVTHSTGMELLIGIDHDLDFKYEKLPEPTGAFDILISVTTAGETYGSYHHVEPDEETQQLLQDGGYVGEQNGNAGYKYMGTYIVGHESIKAIGTFQSRKDREILPFRKFEILLNGADGKELDIRIFGSETVQDEKIHNMTMGIKMRDTNILKFVTEINPSNETPLKAQLYWKDYGEMIILDKSNFPNKRNLQVEGKCFPAKLVMEAKVELPTSIMASPLYLDLEAVIFDEQNRSKDDYRIVSSSLLNFREILSVKTDNEMHVGNLNWKVGLDTKYIDDDMHQLDSEYKRQNAFTFSAYVTPANSTTYSLELIGHYYSDQYVDSHHKYSVKMQRPNVTPFQLLADVRLEHKYEIFGETDLESRDYNESSYYNATLQFISCHKDNFLYVFPTIEIDYNVAKMMEIRINTAFAKKQYSSFKFGRFLCKSIGGNQLPWCNFLNSTLRSDSKHYAVDWNNDNPIQPELFNFQLVNQVDNFSDEIVIKMITNHERVKEREEDQRDDDYNILLYFINTVHGKHVFRKSYNIDYQLQRKFETRSAETQKLPLCLEGTYIITQLYENWDFFQFTDHHKWNAINADGFHVWTNAINHTTVSIQNKEIAYFSSHYVSVDSVSAIANKNTTWMELKSTFSMQGFEPLTSIVQDPALLLKNSEGSVEADFLVSTQFSPVKAFRVTISHEHCTTNESEDDDDSVKVEALSKLNTLFNDAEMSGTNSITILTGRGLGFGNQFEARLGSTLGVYEYLTLKAFLVATRLLNDSKAEKIIHLDVSSSYTNAEDDDSDLRIVNDVIFSIPVSEVPLIRLAVLENSTHLDLERNTSILIFKGKNRESNSKMGISARLPMSVVSDNLHELSLSQLALQSLAEQIIEDYSSAAVFSDASRREGGVVENEYNMEIHQSRHIYQNYSSKVSLMTNFLSDKDKIYCRSTLDQCFDDGNSTTEHVTDTSNYCNLIILPVHRLMYAVI